MPPRRAPSGDEASENEQFLIEAMTEILASLEKIEQNTRGGGRSSGGGGASTSAGGGAGFFGGQGFGAGARGGGGAAKAGAARGGLAAAGPQGAAIAAAIGVKDKVNKILKPGKKFLQDTVFNGFRNTAQFGAGANFNASFNEAKTRLPFLGDAARQVVDPVKRAGQRTSALTALVARGGGAVSDEDRKALFQRNLLEERRAQKEQRKVGGLVRDELGSSDTNNAIAAEFGQQFDRVLAELRRIFNQG